MKVLRIHKTGGILTSREKGIELTIMCVKSSFVHCTAECPMHKVHTAENGKTYLNLYCHEGYPIAHEFDKLVYSRNRKR